MAPVRVQVRDRSGAVLPGVPVTLTLSAAPDGGAMLGTTTALTDAAGIAQFPGLRFTVPGGGYRMQASVAVPGNLVIPPAQSALFSILPIVVSNANDAGPGSLRQAIVNANNNAGVIDIVTFGGAGDNRAALAAAGDRRAGHAQRAEDRANAASPGRPWRSTAATSPRDRVQASS